MEAARIIQEEGLLDFRSAKAKAAARLGLGRRAHLPDNAEIEAALAERNRIFHGDQLPELLATLRRAAFELMRDLDLYWPRLVGDVLSGNATVHTSVDLHLFSDTTEAVSTSLESLGVSHRSIARRHRLRHDEVEQFPGYRFRQTSPVDVHHDRARWGWELVSAEGVPYVAGVDYALLDADGRLREVTGFFEPPAAQSAS